MQHAKAAHINFCIALEPQPISTIDEMEIRGLERAAAFSKTGSANTLEHATPKPNCLRTCRRVELQFAAVFSTVGILCIQSANVHSGRNSHHLRSQIAARNI